MSGTDVAYPALRLRACYAVCGTEQAYAPTSAVRCAVMRERMLLPMCGTELVYAATQYRSEVLGCDEIMEVGDWAVQVRTQFEYPSVQCRLQHTLCAILFDSAVYPTADGAVQVPDNAKSTRNQSEIKAIHNAGRLTMQGD
eukprot:3217577-Rhodomonas_salina.3